MRIFYLFVTSLDIRHLTFEHDRKSAAHLLLRHPVVQWCQTFPNNIVEFQWAFLSGFSTSKRQNTVAWGGVLFDTDFVQNLNTCIFLMISCWDCKPTILIYSTFDKSQIRKSNEHAKVETAIYSLRSHFFLVSCQSKPRFLEYKCGHVSGTFLRDLPSSFTVFNPKQDELS